VVNSVASSYLTLSQRQPTGEAEAEAAAAARKESKYSSFIPACLFQPIASETLSPLTASAIDVIESIGHRLRVLFDD
jgi:hypothetical protein